ncbi:MAG TPA: hypothetical protein VFY39_13780 [Gammaproteobacteria bacterium]|nr:hypothetical protein [Gammaproteobacteria bacterium]
MSDVRSRREQARKAIATGRLPNREPDRTWGGPGVGAECRICGSPVTQDETEFEIEFAQDREKGGADCYHVHVQCFNLWEHERRAPELTGARAGGRRLKRAATSLAAPAGCSEADAGQASRGLLAGSPEGNMRVDEPNARDKGRRE